MSYSNLLTILKGIFNCLTFIANSNFQQAISDLAVLMELPGWDYHYTVICLVLHGL